MTATVGDAARRYVQAWRRCVGADEAGLLAALIERDTAFHELLAAVGESCPMCAEGFCPYSQDVEEWRDEYDELRRHHPVNVDDPDGLLNEPRP